MNATATAVEKRWGRAGEASTILGVDKVTLHKIASASGIPVRDLPGCSHRLYDLSAVRRLAEESTRPAGRPRTQPIGA
jgi:hypothetical protein